MKWFLFPGPLHAKEDKIREDAVFLIMQLSKQCSDSNAVQAIIKMILDIFNGSYGKLTVNSHKISVLQVRLSFNIYLLWDWFASTL